MYLRQLATSKRILLPLLILATCGLSFADYGDTFYFTYQIGGSVPGPQYQSIVSTTPGRETAGNTVRTSGQSWLQAYISSSTTPFTLTVGVIPTGLSAGTYFGTVQLLCSNCAHTLDFNVNLTVTNPPPPLTASPSSMTFNAVQGATPPPSQTLVIGASISGAMITSDSSAPSWLNAGWIAVGTAPMTVPLSINPSFTNLSPGTYTTSLHFTAPFSSQEVTVPITLNVSAPPPVLRTSTSQLQFQYLAGSSSLPATQAIQVTSSGSVLTTAISLSASWLTANPLNGSTPLTVIVGMNPSGLAAGTYNGQIVVTTTGVFTNSSTQTIGVSLTVALDNRPVITSVVNAASFKSVIGPGTWISIMGTNFAPTTNQTSVPFPISLSGVYANLNGVGGSYNLFIQYVSPTQINAFVQEELPVSFFNTSCSIGITVPTGTASFNTYCQGMAPALFSYGTQLYAAARHLDGSVIGAVAGTRPASAGEIISLWGTGFGQTSPAVTLSLIHI